MIRRPPRSTLFPYTDALPICETSRMRLGDREGGRIDLCGIAGAVTIAVAAADDAGDRKSTRLNSSHQIISYAVFCLKKKKRTRLVLQRRSLCGVLED